MKLDTTSRQMPLARSFATRRSLLRTSGAALAIGCGVARIAGAQPPTTTGSSTLHILEPQRAGELVDAGASPRIVHLWGLTCAPCIEELPRWGDFVRRHPDWRIVFLQVDPSPAEKVSAALRRAGLQNAQNWTVAAPLDERARYRLDPDWAGELPRTLAISADAPRYAVSGRVDFEAMREWFARRMPVEPSTFSPCASSAAPAATARAIHPGESCASPSA